jgi:mRNA interferase RelE/StbE
MKISRTETFKRDFTELPEHAQRGFERKLQLLVQNPRHPSLRVKKMKGHENRWEGSIDLFYRFTFELHVDHILLRRIGPHDAVLRNP